MDILLLLLLLQVKHWYADFKIQTYMQTVKKGVWLDPIGISHTLDHIWTTLVVLFLFSFLHPYGTLLTSSVTRWLDYTFNVWPFITIKIFPIPKNCQSR